MTGDLSEAGALRVAIRDALMADHALVSLLGEPNIYDEPPRAPVFPCVTLGEARVTGDEHHMTLHAWSRQGGHNEAHRVACAVLQALDNAPLPLADHRLINSRFGVADVRREADGRTYHATVRFHAVIEPA